MAGTPTLDVAGDLLLASVDNTLKALDPATRRILWSHSTQNYAATGATVYSVDDDFRLTALRAATGGAAWAWTGPFGEFFGFVRPVTSGPRVIIGVSSTGSVRAIDAATGRLLWTSPVNAADGLAAAADVIIAQDGDDAVLTGLDPASGRKRWHYGMPMGGPPLVRDGLGFASEGYSRLHAVRADSGAPAWRLSYDGVSANLLHSNGFLYLNCESGNIRAVRAATGELVWSRRLGNGEGAAYRATNHFTVAGGAVYAAGTDGMLYALDAATGSPLWTFDIGSPTGAPATAAGLVFVGTNDGVVHAVTPAANPIGTRRAGP
jgi:outer membrane protein assembly factor BamB